MIFLRFIIILFFFLADITGLYSPAFAGFASTEKYDLILAANTEETGVRNRDNKKIQAGFLTFEHNKFPNLDGIWVVKKTTLKRKINPVLSKPTTFIHCNLRLPIEKKDFINKEVIIRTQSPDSFAVRSLYPVTSDIYVDPNLGEDIEQKNYSFKATLDEKDITYAYTSKLKEYDNYASIPRQLWLNGRLNYNSISPRKIIAKGYEIQYTPVCHGFIMDEVQFEFRKTKDYEQQITNPESQSSALPPVS